METAYFLPSPRLPLSAVMAQRQAIVGYPLVETILDGLPNPTILVNQSRQIVLANEAFVSITAKSKDALCGLRPGEALACIHSHAAPDGCQTTAFCQVCGAAKALSGCEASQKKVVEECRISQEEPDVAALDLQIHTCPFQVGGHTFTLFSVVDLTDQKRRSALERVFFHDLLNAAGGIKGFFEVAADLSPEELQELNPVVAAMATQLVDEITAQRELQMAERGELSLQRSVLGARAVMEAVKALYDHHQVARGKSIVVTTAPGTERMIESDLTLLRRVLGNLTKNALEASPTGSTVTLSYSPTPSPTFAVHNVGEMPEAVRLQVFQRSFSTKGGSGRGLGTYSVKLLTERYLRGQASFWTSAADGTTFRIALPAD